ncbi:MAG: hypothetical protein AB1631_17415 [Acidobacteriota bacterium]
MANIIVVKGKTPEGKVAIWERNEQHPDGGEAFVVGGQTAQVAETAAIRAAIADGKLERVEEPKKPTAETKSKAEK